jgi:hypothetical protein
MALRPTVPRRPVSLRLRLLEEEEEVKPPPWSAGAGDRTQAVFCRPRTKNRLLASGGEKKKPPPSEDPPRVSGCDISSTVQN